MLAIFALGWRILLLSTFMITDFNLFELRQVYLLMRGPQLTAYLRQLNKGVYTTNVSAAVRAGFEMTSSSLPLVVMTIGHSTRPIEAFIQLLRAPWRTEVG